MTDRSDRGMVKTRGSQRLERDEGIREPACGLHLGQQPSGTAPTGRKHGCTRPRSSMPKSSCAAEVVHTWNYNDHLIAQHCLVRKSSTTSRHESLDSFVTDQPKRKFPLNVQPSPVKSNIPVRCNATISQPQDQPMHRHYGKLDAIRTSIELRYAILLAK